jgi:hypothetical protein
VLATVSYGVRQRLLDASMSIWWEPVRTASARRQGSVVIPRITVSVASHAGKSTRTFVFSSASVIEPGNKTKHCAAH